MGTELTRVLAAELPAGHEAVLRSALTPEAGCEFRTTDTLDAGTDAADNGGPDVVLLGLPSESDPTPSDRLERALARAAGRPILAVVDSGDRATVDRAVRAGYSDVLPMDTVTPEGARRAVRHVVRVDRLERERRRLEQALERRQSEAFRDPETGLPNRALFLDRLERAVARRRRGEAPDLAVLYLDVDRFEMVNESLGHRVGDELLRALAVRLEEELREEDTVARMRGDEFAILLDGVGELSGPTHVAERIRAGLAAPFRLAGKEIYLSVSMGIAIAGEARDPEGLLRDADTAMHKAKERGPSSYRLFDEAMHDSALALLELETDLRKALERDEFVIHYQPVVDLARDRLAGFEALVRWQHPRRGLVQPDDFLRAAEDTGLIVGLGAMVLRNALEQLRDWRRLDPTYEDIFMSVNLSPRQFSDPALVETIAEMVRQTGVPAGLLRLELTESVVIEDPESVALSLAELRDLGVTLCIDDFGTGYSALNYLHNFPIDVIKIDRSFISRIEEGVEGDVVEAIIALARNLGMAAVAEGVETDIQLARLRKLGSTAVQGFLFSTPLDAEAAERYLRSRTNG